MITLNSPLNPGEPGLTDPHSHVTLTTLCPGRDGVLASLQPLPLASPACHQPLWCCLLEQLPPNSPPCSQDGGGCSVSTWVQPPHLSLLTGALILLPQGLSELRLCWGLYMTPEIRSLGSQVLTKAYAQQGHRIW